MKSRYDFMREGSYIDERTNSAFPDPLSLNYLEFNMTEIPLEDSLTDSKIVYFWKEAENVYGAPIYDDIVLTLNGNSHRNFLKTKDSILFPVRRDIERSFSKGGEVK